MGAAFFTRFMALALAAPDTHNRQLITDESACIWGLHRSLKIRSGELRSRLVAQPESVNVC